MSLTLLRFLAMTFGPSITAAARPATTFLAVQVTVAALAHYDLASLPGSFHWLVSVPAIVVAAVLAGLETAAKHDPDIAAILRDLNVDNMTGAFGAFTAALLFAALGLPGEQAAALAEPSTGGGTGVEPDGGLLDATAQAASAERSTGVQVAAVGGALGLNVGLTWIRSELLEFIDDFELGKLWARLETGGTLGVLVLLPLLPLVALTFIVLSAGVVVAVALSARAAAKFVDRRSRVACESCGYEVREEASVCPECGAEREPTTDRETGLGAAITALRRREPSTDASEVS